MSRDSVLVLGGAGFIGSQVVDRFVRAGHRVRVIDGLLDRTGGREAHLSQLRSRIEWIRADVREVGDFDRLLEGTSVIVDCMAWTSHRLAIQDPLHDLDLNVASHLSYLPRTRSWRSSWPGCSTPTRG